MVIWGGLTCAKMKPVLWCLISWMPYLACSTIEYGSYPNGEEIVLKTTGPQNRDNKSPALKTNLTRLFL